MKTKKIKRLLSILMCIAMLVSLMPVTAFAASYVDFLATNYAVCIASTGEAAGFERVSLTNEGKASYIPVVYRTDNLDLAFDGWYTEKNGGGEKITEETIFNGYDILYDHWVASGIEEAKKVKAVNIGIAAPVNNQTALDWYNASSLDIAAEGVQDISSYELHHGLNASGATLTNNEVLDTSQDYSATTLLRLEDGYYFDSSISLTASNGVRAGTIYSSTEATSNSWNSIARQVLVTINFPAGGGNNNVGFTTEPQSGDVAAGQQYSFTWAVSGNPTGAELQMKNGNDWTKLDDLTAGLQNYTIAAQQGTKTFRVLVTYTNGSIYSNEFTVTWYDANANQFQLQPTSGYAKNGATYDYTWSCLYTPATANLQRKVGNDWTSPENLGTATARTIAYKADYENSTQTFRIEATYGGNTFYSSEFTVEYKNGPFFEVQPANGKVAIGSTYKATYSVDNMGEEFKPNDSYLQVQNGSSWESALISAYATETSITAQNTEVTKTYRVVLKFGNYLLESEPFTVTWVNDYSFELDQNALTWGTVDKTDSYVSKMITVTPTGTLKGTLKYEEPQNFDVQSWDGGTYRTLTFTPKSTLAAGTYNETVNVWTTSDNIDEHSKKNVTLSIIVTAPTYTVSFNAGAGGSGTMAAVNNVSGIYELPANEFTAPDNMQFKAWQVGNQEYDPGDTINVTGNITVTAIWKDIPAVSGYTITFEDGGGSGTMNPVAGASGSYHLPSCTFTAPAGQQFKAWQVNGQGEYQPGAVIIVTADTTVTALWRNIPTEYWTVTVGSTNVCNTSGSYSETQYVEKGQPMSTIIITANDGYYFPENLDIQGAAYGVTATRTSYTQVTISGTPTADNIYIGFGPSTKQKEDTPSNLYFEATGSDTGNLCNLTNGVTYSVTGAATAEFTAASDTYALDNVTAGTLSVVKKASNPDTKLDSDAYDYTVDKNANIPNVTSFNCTDANNNNGQLWNVASDMEYQKEGDNGWITGTGNNITGLTPGTYYVRYKASTINLAGESKVINILGYQIPTYTVSFDANGGFGTMNPKTGIAGDYELPSCTYTAPAAGQQFKAWSVGGVEKAPGETISVTSDTTVTAIWENIPVTYYTVTFDSNGGSAVTALTIEAGQKATKPADPTKSGYDFKGWTLGGSAYDFNAAVNGDITLVATWEQQQVVPTTYTVTFDSVGGSAVTPQNIEAGQKATKPADPTKSGYDFKGWTLNGSAYDFNSAVNGDITLVATWQQKQTGGGLGGGYYVPTVQKPTIEAGEGVKVTLSADGKVASIEALEGYELESVKLNDTEKGIVKEVKDLKTGDKLVVTAKKLPTAEETLAALMGEYKLVARSKKTDAPSGRKAIMIRWYDENDKELDFDGVEIFRSVKKNEGFGTKPIFTSKSGKYYNTSIETGTRYYYMVRGYVELDGVKYYTDWSKKAIRTAE